MKPFSARIKRADGVPCGAGFLVDRRHVISCAHVVNSALRSGDRMKPDWPSESVTLDFPWTEGGTFEAHVVGWHPPASPLAAQRELFDIAVLRLDDEAPMEPAKLEIGTTAWNGLNFAVAGFPTAQQNGRIAYGEISGLLPGHR